MRVCPRLVDHRPRSERRPARAAKARRRQCVPRALPHKRRAVDVRDLGVFRTAGAAAGAEAPPAVCRAGLWGQDVDRAASGVAGEGGDDASGRVRSRPAGR